MNKGMKYTVSIEQDGDNCVGTMTVHTADGHDIQLSAEGGTIKEIYDSLDEGLENCLQDLKKELEEAEEPLPKDEELVDKYQKLTNKYKTLEKKYDSICDSYVNLLDKYYSGRKGWIINPLRFWL